jgi:DNA ligase (NAD+)
MERQELYTISNEFVKKEKSTFSQSDIKKLSEIIELHWKLYYQDENPVISDIDYDELFKKHEYFLEQSWEQISMFSKTWESFSQSSFKKVAHSRAMISLDNTYNAEDLRDFDTRINRILKLDTNLPYTIEFKFDGLWIELIYKDWVLTQAITRGNGQEGEDVTENIKQIKNIPKRINKTWVFEVRGEVVMPISSFERLNKEALENSEKVFSNPRNAASGSLRVLDTSITKKRDLQYFAYDVSDFSEFSQWKYSTMIEELENLGFEISSYFPKCKWIEEVIATIDNIWDIKKNIDFEIDGLVVKVNDISLWKGIWSTEHHPRYAIAYKFPAEIVTTKIESVEHSVGRTGSITPVANLAAVNIGGAVIRRATLHNYDEVEKLWVKIHDNVFLKRAGEVIPKIISVASSPYPDGSKEAEIYAIHPPKLCPSCQNKVLKDDDKVRYYCPNNYGCPAQMREKIAFAVGKQWFNIDGFWEKQAQLFLELWFIKNFWDIFRLKKYREEILALDGFKEKSVNNLLDWIEAVRNTDIVTFLKALGIPWVGKKTAKTLWRVINFKNSDILLWKWDFEMLEKLPDIGPEVASSVIEFFKDQQEMSQDLLSELEITFLDVVNEKKSGKYTWKKMCITWSFEWYKRDDLAKILEQQGGEFMSSVSAKTDYLLAWDKAGSKLKKANELGIEVLTLEEFLK